MTEGAEKTDVLLENGMDETATSSTSVADSVPRWFVRKASAGARHAMAHIRGRLLGAVPGIFFDEIGEGTRFYGFPRFQSFGGKIRIGANCNFGVDVFFLANEGAQVTIGDRVSLNDHGMLASLRSVTIEDGVSIGEFVSIRDYDHEFDGHRSTKDLGYVSAPIVIRRNAWIGRGVAVLKGVTIGEGAVVGANSVVTRDVPPHALVAGSPARFIRELRLTQNPA